MRRVDELELQLQIERIYNNINDERRERQRDIEALEKRIKELEHKPITGRGLGINRASATEAAKIYEELQ